MCSLFGCNFFVASMPGDVMTHDVCVPSWAAKSVNKSDQAFFEPKVAVHSVLMHIPEHVRHPTLVDVQLTFISCSMGPKERNELGTTLSPSGRFCHLYAIGRCHMLMLVMLVLVDRSVVGRCWSSRDVSFFFDFATHCSLLTAQPSSSSVACIAGC